MRILVDKMPENPQNCIFCNMREICRITINPGGLNQKFCKDTKQCEFLMEVKHYGKEKID